MGWEEGQALTHNTAMESVPRDAVQGEGSGWRPRYDHSSEDSIQERVR